MKLAKVKGLCQTAGAVVTVQKDAGLDIKTWVGDGSSLYPLRGIQLNAEEIRSLWDVDQDKMAAREVAAEGNVLSLLCAADIFIDGEHTGIEEICDINGMLMLYDTRRERSILLNTKYLAPCNNKDRAFAWLDAGGVAVYGQNVLEAIVMPVEMAKDGMEQILAKLSLIYNRERGT